MPIYRISTARLRPLEITWVLAPATIQPTCMLVRRKRHQARYAIRYRCIKGRNNHNSPSNIALWLQVLGRSNPHLIEFLLVHSGTRPLLYCMHAPYPLYIIHHGPCTSVCFPCPYPNPQHISEHARARGCSASATLPGNILDRHIAFHSARTRAARPRPAAHPAPPRRETHPTTASTVPGQRIYRL